MFTGLIEEMGTIQKLTPSEKQTRIQIEAKSTLLQANVGDSLAVNGCCLTITSLKGDTGEADVIAETLKRTCLGELQVGDPVNLERPLSFNGRLGGHLVQGHVDGIAQINDITPLEDGSTMISFKAPPNILRYVVEKGSIAIDGISLTVAAVNANTFSVAMIPHTAHVTTLGCKRIGSHVNVEVDLIAKYVEKFTTLEASS